MAKFQVVNSEGETPDEVLFEGTNDEVNIFIKKLAKRKPMQFYRGDFNVQEVEA